MKVLVTGATGFVGRRAIVALAEAGHEVVAATRERPPDGGESAEWLSIDLSRPADGIALPEYLDAVVHLAQSHRYRDFPEGAPDIFAVNLASTFALIEQSRRKGACKFVLASTGGVYGPGDHAREGDLISSVPPNSPLAFYLNSKYAAELVVGSYASLIETVIIRPFFIYGPGQPRTLVRILAERVLAGEPVSIHGQTGMRVNPIYVDDAVQAISAALDPGPEGVFNLAGEEVVSIAELVALIGELAGREPKIDHLNEEQEDLVADTTRLREKLGVTPKTSLRDGVGELLRSLQ